MRAGIIASARHAPAGAYRQEVLADSPFCYFPFDEASGVPVDVMGNRALTVHGTSPVLGAPGIGDGATCAQFNSGADADCWTTTTTTIGTIEALVNVTDVTNAAILADTEVPQDKPFRVSGGKVQWIGGSPWPTSITGATTLSTGTTYHLAATFSAEMVRLYVNGTLDAQATHTVTAYGGLSIGSRVRATPGYRNTVEGRMAGFAIHSAALPAARILAHAQAAGVA